MSQRQRFIVWGWIAVAVIAGLFPPWTDRGYPDGYHLIFAPPVELVRIDVSRLVIEWIVSTVIAAGLYFVWPIRRNPAAKTTRPPKLPREHAPMSERHSKWIAESALFAVALAIFIAGASFLLHPTNLSSQPQRELPPFDGYAVPVPPSEPTAQALPAEPPQRAMPTVKPDPNIDWDAIAKESGAIISAPPRDSVIRKYVAKDLPRPFKLPEPPPYTRPALDPYGQPWPTKSGYFKGFEQRNIGGRSNLTVDNSGSNSDVVVAVYDHIHDQPMRVFFLLAHDKFTPEHFTPGQYDVRYKDLSSGVISRSDPFVFSETEDEISFHWSNAKITLYRTIDPEHPINFETISPIEFVTLPPRQ